MNKIYNDFEIDLNDDFEIVDTRTLSMCLCDGYRHIPNAIDGTIFPSIFNATDIQQLDIIVDKKLSIHKKLKQLNVYVTGSSSALISVINYCIKNNISLTLYHYDNYTTNYYSQEVI